MFMAFDHDYCLFSAITVNCESVSLLAARRTNNLKVVGSKSAKVVCISVGR